MVSISREEIIKSAKEAEIKQGNPIRASDFSRITGISQYHIYKLFPRGGWSEVKRLGNLNTHSHNTTRLSNNEILSEIHRVVTQLGYIPTWAEFDSSSKVSADSVRRRFDGSTGMLKSYRKWLLDNYPDSPFIGLIDIKLKKGKPTINPVKSPNLKITSSSVEEALKDAEQLIHSRGSKSAVDRAHTAFHGYMIAVAKQLNLTPKKGIELTELFQIIRENHPALKNVEREILGIYRGISKILESINYIRDNRSLVHPNQSLLKESEAMLVINITRTLLHYIDSKIKT
ncbi:MAG: abortive infection family protein [Anaerolineales bacterium]|nr:abortive infection family protein [Anaerolineales bacterium]